MGMHAVSGPELRRVYGPLPRSRAHHCQLPVCPAVNREQSSPSTQPSGMHTQVAWSHCGHRSSTTGERPAEGALICSELRLASRTCCAVINPTFPSYAAPILQRCTCGVEENPNASDALLCRHCWSQLQQAHCHAQPLSTSRSLQGF